MNSHKPLYSAQISLSQLVANTNKNIPSENRTRCVTELTNYCNDEYFRVSLHEGLESDIGRKAIFKGEEVYLDYPMIDDEIIGEKKSNDKYKGKKSGKPSRNSGGKSYKVYVSGCNEKTKTNPRGIKKLTFGSGMRAKINDPDARKRYDSRHGCSEGKHNDKCKAGYWSCRLPRFSSSIGLSYNGSAQWW